MRRRGDRVSVGRESHHHDAQNASRNMGLLRQATPRKWLRVFIESGVPLASALLILCMLHVKRKPRICQMAKCAGRLSCIMLRLLRLFAIDTMW